MSSTANYTPARCTLPEYRQNASNTSSPWYYYKNSRGSDPCQVYQTLMRTCTPGFTLPLVADMFAASGTPNYRDLFNNRLTTAQRDGIQNECYCSVTMYNLLQACEQCQPFCSDYPTRACDSTRPGSYAQYTDYAYAPNFPQPGTCNYLTAPIEFPFQTNASIPGWASLDTRPPLYFSFINFQEDRLDIPEGYEQTTTTGGATETAAGSQPTQTGTAGKMGVRKVLMMAVAGMLAASLL